VSYVDMIKAIEHAKLRAARRAVETMRRECEPIIRQLTNIYLDTFPPFPFKDRLADQIADRIIAVVREFCDYVLDVIAFFDELVEWLGSPDALRAAADALLRDVDGPANDLVLEMKQTALPARFSWVDPPPSAVYGVAADAQPGELERLLPFIATLREVLRGMADSIESFYIDLVTAIVGLVGAIAGAVVTLAGVAGVITIPVAIATGVATVASLLLAINAINDLVNTHSQEMGDLLDSCKSGFSHTWVDHAGFAEIR